MEFANAEESEKLLKCYRKINNTVLGFLTDEETSSLLGTDVKTTVMWYRYKTWKILLK